MKEKEHKAEQSKESNDDPEFSIEPIRKTKSKLVVEKKAKGDKKQKKTQ